MSTINPLFNIQKDKKSIKGIINLYKLESWWNNNFTSEEKNQLISIGPDLIHLEGILSPAFAHFSKLIGIYYIIEDEILKTKFESALDILFQPYFIDNFDITNHVIQTYKDTDLLEYYLNDKNNLVWHLYPATNIRLYLNHKVEYYYKRRNIGSELEKCKFNCKLLIEKSKFFLKYQIMENNALNVVVNEIGSIRKLPRFPAYNRYVIILEKEEEYEEAIKLIYRCIDESWDNEWGNKLNTLEKKMNLKKTSK
jgi:hypothetical protein